jgi:hypothetical protein
VGAVIRGGVRDAHHHPATLHDRLILKQVTLSLHYFCCSAATAASSATFRTTRSFTIAFQMAWIPRGTAADIAEFAAPYVLAGCTTLNFIPFAGSSEAAIDAVAEVREILILKGSL